MHAKVYLGLVKTCLTASTMALKLAGGSRGGAVPPAGGVGGGGAAPPPICKLFMFIGQALMAYLRALQRSFPALSFAEFPRTQIF